MQKQIDATLYIVPYKTDDRMNIIILRYARRQMCIVLQGCLTLWRHSALRCDVTPRYAVMSLRITLWRHSALRCDVTPRYVVTWLFTRKTPSYKIYTCQNLMLTAAHQTKICGPWPMANAHSSALCIACRQLQQWRGYHSSLLPTWMSYLYKLPAGERCSMWHALCLYSTHLCLHMQKLGYQ